MSFATVGTVTVTPDDDEVVVGSFSMAVDDDTLWARVTQKSPAGPWPWSYGILSWRTSFGNELGSIKCFGDVNGEVFKLGVGLAPLERTGQLIFEPRSYNLAWTRNGYPWTLEFEAQSGNTTSGGGGDSGGGAFGGILSDTAGALLTYAFREGFAYLLIP